MPKINKDAVIRLFDNNGFDYELKGVDHHFVYETDNGFSMDFVCTWLTDDPLAEYDLGSVRKYMTSLINSAKYEESIYSLKNNPQEVKQATDALREYGMMYDEKENAFYKIENDVAIFGTDIDYLIALKAKSKNAAQWSYGEMLEDMYKSAKEEKTKK